MSGQEKWSIEEEAFIKKALAAIPETPKDRITENVRKTLQKNNYIYDVHVHAFDKKSINELYFVFQFIREYIKGGGNNGSMSDQELAATRLLEKMEVNSIEDIYGKKGKRVPEWREIERIISSVVRERGALMESEKGELEVKSTSEFFWFILRRFFKSGTQSEMLDFYYQDYSLHRQVPKFHNKDMITCLLMMDFYKEFADRTPKKSMWKQVLEINELADRKDGHPVLPFLALDPRRVGETGKENLYELFLKAFDRNKGGRFFGVKLYPALGYSVSDYRLEPFYHVCEKLNIPVVSHCGGEMVSTFKTTIKVYKDFDDKKEITVERNQDVNGNARRQRIFNLNDPSEFVPVLEKFKKLKLNIAHFGGNDAWIPLDLNKVYHERVGTTVDLMSKYDGVFTDFSFCLTDKGTYQKLNRIIRNNNIVKDRLMYGTDYWVVLFNDDDKFKECLNLFSENVLSDQNVMQRMLTNNPDEYLFKEVYERSE